MRRFASPLIVTLQLIPVLMTPAASAMAVEAPAGLQFTPYLPRYTAPTQAAIQAQPKVAADPAAAASTASGAAPASQPPILPAGKAPLAPTQSAAIVPPASLDAGERVVATTSPVPGEAYRLEAGLPLEDQLMAWSKRAGWTILWNLPPDANWIVPGAVDFGTDFQQAITRVIQTLARNGADIRGAGFRDNRTFVIRPAGNQ